jgi:hypothetical protein
MSRGRVSHDPILDTSFGEARHNWGPPPTVLREFGGTCLRCLAKVLRCEWFTYRCWCENCWVLLQLSCKTDDRRVPSARYFKVLPPERNGLAGKMHGD